PTHLLSPWSYRREMISAAVRFHVTDSWVVERSLAWMMHARRHARDYERLIQHSETLITWAAITLMTRRLARKGATPSWPRKPAPADA
ncbi:hypothetical protein AB0P37_50250, partial [Streptomyces antimycoticus]